MTFSKQSKIGKVQLWLKKQPPGTCFTSKEISKKLDLHPYTVGCTLKWQDNVEKAKSVSGVHVWRKI